MIKIIKPGTLRKVTCNNCGAVLRYDTTEDMKTENVESFLGAGVKAYKRQQQYIICPQCEYKIVLNAVSELISGMHLCMVIWKLSILLLILKLVGSICIYERLKSITRDIPVKWLIQGL